MTEQDSYFVFYVLWDESRYEVEEDTFVTFPTLEEVMAFLNKPRDAAYISSAYVVKGKAIHVARNTKREWKLRP